MCNLDQNGMRSNGSSISEERKVRRRAEALALMAAIHPGRALVPFLTADPAVSNIEAIACWMRGLPGHETLSLGLLHQALIKRLESALETF